MEDDATIVTSLLPMSGEAPQKLSDRINLSTRPIHSQLNRLILARLPLALPPYALHPSTYTSGLIRIAPVYITFETLWQTILNTPPQPVFSNPCCCDADNHVPCSTTPIDDQPAHTICTRMHSLLKYLRLPGLLREKRLRADISALSGDPEFVVEEQLCAVSSKGKLARFIAHTKRSVKANPHVLLAYAWVLYMALFSGGRHLRVMLQSAGGAGEDFWNRDPLPGRPQSETSSMISQADSTWQQEAPSDTCEYRDERKETCERPRSSRARSDLSPIQAFSHGMQFFNFAGDEDGEDIKSEFKRRMTDSEHLLTEKEKADIVNESQMIFEFMVELVGELDKVMETNQDDLEAERLHRSFRSKMTSRDSLTVAQERLSKGKTESDNADPQCLLPDLSVLRNTLPSLYTVPKPDRRVNFDLLALRNRDDTPGIRVGTASLKTVIAALVAGVALLLAWCLIL